MDVFPKFIIETDPEEGDVLIIGKCTYHRQLSNDPAKVKGGGWWTLNQSVDKSFILFGSSEDFGKAKIELIADCIKRKKVFSSMKSFHRNFTDNYTFRYRDEVGDIIDLDNYSPE